MLNPLNKHGKSQDSLVGGSAYTMYFNQKCLGKKNLPLQGWGGRFTSKEAARGAFQLDCFQNIGDPLADSDPTLRPVVKQVSFDFI